MQEAGTSQQGLKKQKNEKKNKTEKHYVRARAKQTSLKQTDASLGRELGTVSPSSAGGGSARWAGAGDGRRSLRHKISEEKVLEEKSSPASEPRGVCRSVQPMRSAIKCSKASRSPLHGCPRGPRGDVGRGGAAAALSSWCSEAPGHSSVRRAGRGAGRGGGRGWDEAGPEAPGSSSGLSHADHLQPVGEDTAVTPPRVSRAQGRVPGAAHAPVLLDAAALGVVAVPAPLRVLLLLPELHIQLVSSLRACVGVAAGERRAAWCERPAGVSPWEGSLLQSAAGSGPRIQPRPPQDTGGCPRGVAAPELAPPQAAACQQLRGCPFPGIMAPGRCLQQAQAVVRLSGGQGGGCARLHRLLGVPGWAGGSSRAFICCFGLGGQKFPPQHGCKRAKRLG